MDIDIRQVRAGDEHVFSRVADDVFDEPVRADRLKAYLAAPGHLMVVALRDGVVVGQTAAVVHRQTDRTLYRRGRRDAGAATARHRANDLRP